MITITQLWVRKRQYRRGGLMESSRINPPKTSHPTERQLAINPAYLIKERMQIALLSRISLYLHIFINQVGWISYFKYLAQTNHSRQFQHLYYTRNKWIKLFQGYPGSCASKKVLKCSKIQDI